jgi:hypothetical protein
MPRHIDRVTWLLPVRNAMPHLPQTLASMAAQTHRDHVVLAWDDGSTDTTREELHRWIPDRLRGTVFSGAPAGLPRALNHLIDHAETELLARIDGDDLNRPDRLTRQVAFMREHPEVDVVGGQIALIDGHGRAVPGAWQMPCGDADIRWRLRVCNALNHPTVMFRRSALQAVGGYRDLQPGQDYDLWVRLAPRHRMANLPQVVVDYRQHAGSISGRAGHERARRLRRDVAAAHIERLLPGLSAKQGMRLWNLLTHPDCPEVEAHDCRTFRAAAGSAALEAGMPLDYFRQTARYRSQFRDLVMRWLRRQTGIRLAWPAARRLLSHRSRHASNQRKAA